MTPLYDVLSTWPIIGRKNNQLPLEKAKLAMAVLPDLWSRMIAFVESADAALERVEDLLPASFPQRVFTTIQRGVREQARRFRDGVASLR